LLFHNGSSFPWVFSIVTQKARKNGFLVFSLLFCYPFGAYAVSGTSFWRRGRAQGYLSRAEPILGESGRFDKTSGGVIMPGWILISYLVVSVLCIFGAVKLFGADQKSYGKSALSSYLAYTVVFLAIWIFRVEVPAYTLFLTMLAVLGNCFFGHYMGGYTKSKTYDRYLHAFGTFSFALFVYCILVNFVEAGGSRLFRAIFIFSLGGTLGVLFEMIEMLHDKKKNEEKSQKGLQDTNMDMLANLIGSLLAAIFAYFWLVG
jgi:hypothetical protein